MLKLYPGVAAVRFCAGVACALALTGGPARAVLPAQESTGLAAIKEYLVRQVSKMDGAAHDFLHNAEAYQQIIDANGGDYDKAALSQGPRILSLVNAMREDYLGMHMNGYETVEGIAAGVHELVGYDILFDSGVPKSQGSADNPVAPVTLRDAAGNVIADQDGNLFHYVIEPCLYGGKENFVRRLSSPASKALDGAASLPLANVLLAAARMAGEQSDAFLSASKSWDIRLDECIGALVWMTPTFNSYFDDLRESLYGDHPTAYISESRVKDMRGIMGSLRLIYNAMDPALEQKDPALARQLRAEYDGIMDYIDGADARDQRARAANGKLSRAELEEMANHAKSMSDQLGPQIKQAAAIMGVQIPGRPFQ